MAHKKNLNKPSKTSNQQSSEEPVDGFAIQNRKAILLVTVSAVSILLLITLWSVSKQLFGPPALPSEISHKTFNYQAYLKAVPTDPAASRALMQQLITEDDIRKEVETELQVNKPIPTRSLSDAQLKVVSASGEKPVVEYITKVATVARNFNHATGAAMPKLFRETGTPSDASAVAAQTDTLIRELALTPVPKEALQFHKSNLLVLKEFSAFARIAESYQNDPSSSPWPDIYQSFAVMNEAAITANAEYEKLDKKYSIGSIPIASQDIVTPTDAWVKHAQAFPVIVTGNIWQEIKDGIREAIASAFSSFMASFLEKTITRIENTYAISNFLYYSDALVRGQYVDDYLNKYVPDKLDQQLVTKFIPQFNCGGSREDIKNVLRAKAEQYINADPAVADFTQPGFEEKMARRGDIRATPEGWELLFQDMADQALNQAEKAAFSEITTPTGKKALRDGVNAQIKTTVSAIADTQLAALINSLGLGTNNAELGVVGSVVKTLVQSLFNKFVFQGAVYQEQRVCAPLPTLTPILPQE